MRYGRFVAVAVALVLGACGGSGHTAATTSTSRSKSASASTTTSFDPAAVAAKPSPGCATATARAVGAGETKITMTSSGVERWYIRHVPPAHDGTTPIPLVIDLHGYEEGADVHVQMSGFGTYGDAHGFATVTPQGSGKVAQWDTGAGSADQKFIADMLDAVEQTMCIDMARVFVSGLSNGAMMASALACSMADRIAAVAPVAGVAVVDGCNAARPVPVVAIHGTADPIVSYDGGIGAGAAALLAPDGSGKTLGEEGLTAKGPKGKSVPETVAAWAARNGCGPTATTTKVSADVDLIAYPCPAPAAVELYRVNGGGHAWPGSAVSKAIVSIVGFTTFTVSADDLIWKFFAAHPLT